MVKRVLDIIGWLGTALVLASVAVFFTRPAWQPYARWVAWAGLVCILLYVLGQWRDMARFFAKRRARLGTLSILSILIVAGILGGINYITSRENKRWDLTANRVYTLSDQTRKVLAGLDAPLRMIAFAREQDFERFRMRLPEYEYASKKVSVEYVDPDKRPALARQYQVQSYNTVVLEYKGRTERVVSDAEQDLTNSIIKVISGQQKKIYCSQGHGEKDPTSSDERAGYSGVATALGRDNYTVEKLVLAQQSDVPADASVVIVAGPKVDFLPQEVDMLRRYLQKGGKLLLMLDPPDTADSPPLANLIALAKDWDVEVGSNVVVDVSGVGRLFGTDEFVPVSASYPTHPITDHFDLLTAYPLARSVTPIPGGVNSRYAQSFVETSPRSWSETDLKTLMAAKEVKFDQAKGDKQGPISIAAAVSATATEAPSAQTSRDKNGKKDETSRPETRVVVVGDSDFASNGTGGLPGNRNLFMNIVNWLGQQENLIAIRPREPEDRRLVLTADQQRRIAWLALVVIPGLIIGSGVYTWWRRR